MDVLKYQALNKVRKRKVGQEKMVYPGFELWATVTPYHSDKESFSLFLLLSNAFVAFIGVQIKCHVH